MNQFDDENMRDEENSESFAEFEAHLTLALRRVDAPPGFADRVVAQTQANRPPAARVLQMMSRRQAWLGGAVAAALLLGVFGAEQGQQRRQQQRAAMAQQQFEAGIRITDQALDHAREQLERAGVEVGR